MWKRRMKRTMLVLLLLMIIAFGIVYWLKKREKGLPISLPVVTRNTMTQYLMPFFSTNGPGIAFVKVRVQGEGENQARMAAICISDLKGKQKKKAKEIPLGDNQEIIIKELDFQGQSLVFEKRDYKVSKSELHRCNLKTGEYQKECASPGPVVVQGGNRATIADSENDKGKTLEIMRQDGSLDIVKRAYAPFEHISSPQFTETGEHLLFQLRILENELYNNQLMSYSLKKRKLSKISDDVLNVIPSPDGKVVAFLVPLFRGGKEKKGGERWDLITRNLSEEASVAPVQEAFSEDLELYTWSKDGRGFLFRKGTTLCFYEIGEGEWKILLDSKVDGWWGYPLSPYYLSCSPDSKKVAALTCIVSQDRQSQKERVLLIDIESASKLIIYEEIIPNVKGDSQQTFGFHSRIVWSSSGDYIAFEGKAKREPNHSDIFLKDIKEDTIINLSRRFLGIFSL